ncbi:hypothetical protein [Enterococcus sp. 5B3_DIV0040]|uniref:hypothetical protein n=1 Tax=Enterococcus sp. 5B3_DIV0040 TaxID=1834182 RepID=UPI000A350DB7|nr:hypothetical protein [Enterococcus sp. 5B3_DIV0040]OTO05120.1 hypothetical protein A5883_002110 [Enterococcus sp. 5B3_DIV0040]
MKKKQICFCLFVIVSMVLLVYSVVDQYKKELPKGLMEFSWQRSVCFDYPFFLFFFGFLPVSFAVVGKDFRRREERKSHSMFFRVKEWFYKVVFPFGLLLFGLSFSFFSDSCVNEKIVFFHGSKWCILVSCSFYMLVFVIVYGLVIFLSKREVKIFVNEIR